MIPSTSYCRLLRSVKNALGATNEVGVFEMRSDGLVEVLNSSEAFLAERARAPGFVTVVTMEGTRPLLVEVHSPARPATRQSASYCQRYRLQLVHNQADRCADPPCRTAFHGTGHFVNVVGGMTTDLQNLPPILAVCPSHRFQRGIVISYPLISPLIGEVGLSGELAARSASSARLREAAKLGFKRCLIPNRRGAADRRPLASRRSPSAASARRSRLRSRWRSGKRNSARVPKGPECPKSLKFAGNTGRVQGLCRRTFGEAIETG
ncbi:MAG: hypothetical protein U0528_01050 [Anaerolineae bacterium]